MAMGCHGHSGHMDTKKMQKDSKRALLFDLFDLFALQCIAHCFWALHLGEPTGKQ
jgi:hypothetical protein